MDHETQRKWDRAAARFDFMAGGGPEKRWRPVKQELFSRMGPGKILFVAVGTGLDIDCFPPGRDIVGLDISARMLAKAKPRAEAYRGRLTLRQLDVHALDYPDDTFDQVFTSCTFCSVPRPVAALKSLWRVLRSGGELGMFEHTGSLHVPFRWMLDLMTPLSRWSGPDLNRPTVSNVLEAGFDVLEVRNHFLDVVKTIYATKSRTAELESTSPFRSSP